LSAAGGSTPEVERSRAAAVFERRRATGETLALRLVFFDSGATDSPSTTIRRAYELLPGVEPPEWE
jgi:hypothetical protein